MLDSKPVRIAAETTQQQKSTVMPSDKSKHNHISIRLENVSKSYNTGRVRVDALKDVSMEVSAGEFIVFLGPSGSGKTTMLNVIGGLDCPTSGQIVVNGIDITGLDDSGLTRFRRTQVGFIFQFFNLIPTLTAKENVDLAADLVKSPGSTDKLLDAVGLGERKEHFPGELSGGENQRVAIARALATNPAVLLCDEPTGSLDYEMGKRIFKLLRELNERQQKTVVVVTHNTAIGQIANRVIHLHDGTIASIIKNAHPLDPMKLTW
jgi:putative ABC transport system ATP-binding protein